MSKLSFYCDLACIPYVLRPQDLSRLDMDAPHGKLPYALLEDGRVLPDSNEIIATLEREGRGRLDAELGRAARADMLAWTRLCDEHLYWSGVVWPRWSIDENFERYAGMFCAGTTPSPAQNEALRRFRRRILAELEGHGMGRRGAESVLAAFRTDVDAIADKLEASDFLLGGRIHSGDAGLYAMLVHVIDAPFSWSGRDYARSKPALVRYCRNVKTVLEHRRRAIA